MTTEEKLQHLLDSSMEASRAEIAHTLSAYIKAMDQIFSEHAKSVREKCELEIRMETERLRKEGNRQLSAEQLNLRRQINQKEEELANELFIEVENLLETYMSTQDYADLLLHQIREAARFAGTDPYTIYLDPADADKLQALSAASGASLSVSRYSFRGGTRAVIPARHVLIDNSFETKLAEAREHFSLERRYA